MRSLRSTRIISQKDCNTFAKLSGDFNPIHVDLEFSTRTRFGKTVIHGALLVTVLRGLTEQLVPNGSQISHFIKFTAPSYVGESLDFFVFVKEHKSNKIKVSFNVQRTNDKVVSCEGEAELINATLL